MERFKKLVLLHSNDLHGDFLAEKVDEQLIGGVSMLSGYISKTRTEEKNTLYCIAGDMFRGSVIDSEYQGISTIEIMNCLSPDVVTIGNHETDYGLAHLLFLEKCARFPIVNANMYIKTNHAHLFKSHEIIEIDGMKVLFIGILTEQVLAQTKTEGLIGTIVNVEEAALEVGKICDAYNSTDIDFTVLLTHIGFEEDKKLAAQLNPAWGVDIIIGGHSHTFLTEPAVVNGIPVVQAGTGTDLIGRFDITVDTENNRISSYTWKCIPINSKNCPRDTELEDLITHYKETTDQKYNRVITRFARTLTHPDRNQETELGAVFADALKRSLLVDIMLLGSGSIRCEKLGPIVTLSDLTESFPYDDAIYMLVVTGAQLKKMIKYMVRDEVWEGAHTEFYQLSEGFRVIYDRATHGFEAFTLDDEEIGDEKTYSVAVQDYHMKNISLGLGVTLEEVSMNRKPRMIATSCRSVLEEYLTAHQNLDHTVGDRLTVK